MHEPGPDGPVNPDVRFEKQDAGVFGLVVFFLGFVFCAVVAHVLLYAVFVGMQRDRQQEANAAVPSAVTKERPTFPKDLDQIPEPRIQERDERDMADLLARDRALLEGEPAWADAKKGAVRIPIEQALTILSDPAQAAKYGLKTAETKGPK